MRTLFILISLTLPILSPAVTTEFAFDGTVDEQRYLAYISKIRCLVCQNESLGSSRAELAIDLRRQIFRMMDEGNTNSQISAYLIDRYGDFILYEPPLKRSTVLLWLAPFILLISLLMLLLLRIKRMKDGTREVLSAEQTTLAQEILSGKSDK